MNNADFFQVSIITAALTIAAMMISRHLFNLLWPRLQGLLPPRYLRKQFVHRPSTPRRR
jgi:hypothetical protein